MRTNPSKQYNSRSLNLLISSNSQFPTHSPKEQQCSTPFFAIFIQNQFIRAYAQACYNINQIQIKNMLRAEQRRLTRKHSQKVEEIHLSYRYACSGSGSTPVLKKLDSRDSTETDDEHEENQETKDASVIANTYLSVIESADFKDFVDKEIQDGQTQMTYY